LFPNASFSQQRLEETLQCLGNEKSKLVIDLSCRRKENSWFVATNKWQTITDFELNQGNSWSDLQIIGFQANQSTLENIKLLEAYCSEFLIHAADVEGLQQGIDEDLVSKLSQWCSIPITYAGGASNITDLDFVQKASAGKVDLTIGSALDIFGGKLVKFKECVQWNLQQNR
jgi:phosphoribosylformimino-5-aminoimidazole carboxamide ribotide isomerase